MSAVNRLDPKRRLVIGVLMLIMTTAGFASGRTLFRPTRHVVQPIQFNHQKHVKTVGMECSACHEHFSTGDHSGLPSIDVCMGCHAGEPLTNSPEEQKLRALTNPLPTFQKLFRLPDHVRYSHSRHVVAGRLTCDTCHGGIADTTAPPASPLVRITMSTCIGCHLDRGVKTDCTQCHR